jgi:hypothetical protein
MTKIFDDQGLHVGSIIDGAVIDEKGVRRAHVSEECFFDDRGFRIGGITNGNIFDEHGFRRGIFEHGAVIDDRGFRVGSVDGPEAAVGAAALVLLLTDSE